MVQSEIRKITLTLKSFLFAQPRPILVHQMGKVGSTTVCQTLRKAGFSPWHLHHVSAARWHDARQWYFDTGQRSLPRHFYLDLMARLYLNSTFHRVKVITLVRDPIARYVSSMFQVPKLHGIDPDQPSNQIAHKIEKKLSDTKLEYAYTWFSEEFETVHDFDVFAHRFSKKQGYDTYTTERADIMIIQVERLSDVIEGALSDFVNFPLRMVRANVGGKKERGSKYSQVKKQIRLSSVICRDLYDSRWMRHFYSEQQIRDFTKKWSSEAATSRRSSIQK